MDIDLIGGSITTTGGQAYGVIGWHTAATGAIDVVMRDVAVRTGAAGTYGVVTIYQGAGTVAMSIDVEGGAVETAGLSSHAVFGWRQSGSGDIAIDLRDVDVRTTSTGVAHAVLAQHAGTAGSVDISVRGGFIETFGQQSMGVFGRAVGTPGNIEVRVADASIVTRGRFARAVAATHEGAGDVTVSVSGGVSATSEGAGGEGVYAIHAGSGDVGVTVGADVAIKAPFDTGIYGHQSRSTGVPGRIVIASGGAIEALNAGILAWVEPRSGHTFGGGGVATGGGDVTQPMIHVTSSGDITVGAGVTDAWIRAAVAGDDGTLSAAERNVFDAVVADDSDALDTALAALPASYDAAWKTRVRGFRAARATVPTDFTSHAAGADPGTPGQTQSFQAAAEILQLPRAGIRAMALSHNAIANFIRQSDTDPAIIAIPAASRTAQQSATLAAQHMLSAAERRVLAAVLDAELRGDLEAALTALPVNAVSPNLWRDAIRRFAQGYSTGDIRVDVTGGAIVSDGDGVHARYAMMRDRNGAIAVTVAEGATVSGERNGVYVGGAGLAEGSTSLRDQTVTVNGVVMGGTGAGVHLAGGGTVVVGRNGRIGASSGVGISSDGAGELVVVIADPDEFGAVGVPRVQGRIEEAGGGRPRVLLQRSGTVGAASTVELMVGEAPVPSGAWDVSVEEAGSGGGLAFVREFGPRARVYEALPSMLLGMNGLARFRERMSAPRTDDGAWARVETSFGGWKAETSTTGGLEYSHRRHGLRAGRDVAVGEESLLGVSLHHRRGSADVRRGGEIDLSGSGAGVSWAWSRDGAYVDAQTEVTWYEAGFRSSSRGTLKEDVSGRGHALGLEVGRRMAMPGNWGGGMVFTPRAGVEHSKVTLDDFTDAVGARVSMEEARSLKGRVGLVAEAVTDGSPHRLSGSLDLEHEFEDDAKVRMTGADLKPEGEPTWVRLGLAGSRAWGDGGRYTLSGGVSYARGGDSSEFTGGATWKMRF